MSEIKQVWGIIKDYQCADLKMVQEPALAVWKSQQAIIDDLKAQLNSMEVCYIEKKKQVEELRERIDDVEAECKDWYRSSGSGLAVRILGVLRGEHETD